jgi:hypothetical protein
MIKRHLTPTLLATILFAAAPASAQTIGPLQWRLAPYGSVLHLTITPQGGIYLLHGFEAQCGGNASLPVYGVAVPQTNGQIFFGLTSINELGRGLHTRAVITASNLTGTWSDNAGNSNQAFVFNPGTTCPGGPRTGPITPDPAPLALAALQAELESLRTQLEALTKK